MEPTWAGKDRSHTSWKVKATQELLLMKEAIGWIIVRSRVRDKKKSFRRRSEKTESGEIWHQMKEGRGEQMWTGKMAVGQVRRYSACKVLAINKWWEMADHSPLCLTTQEGLSYTNYAEGCMSMTNVELAFTSRLYSQEQ